MSWFQWRYCRTPPVHRPRNSDAERWTGPTPLAIWERKCSSFYWRRSLNLNYQNVKACTSQIRWINAAHVEKWIESAELYLLIVTVHTRSAEMSLNSTLFYGNISRRLVAMLQGTVVSLYVLQSMIIPYVLPDGDRQRYMDKFKTLGIDKSLRDSGDWLNWVDRQFSCPTRRHRRRNRRKLLAQNDVSVIRHAVLYYFLQMDVTNC